MEGNAHLASKEKMKEWFGENYEVMLEYPIYSNPRGKEPIFGPLGRSSWLKPLWEGSTPPTKEEIYERYGFWPRVIDVVLLQHGSPEVGIEICDTNAVDERKVDYLQRFGVTKLIEMKSWWVMEQATKPEAFIYKALIGKCALPKVPDPPKEF